MDTGPALTLFISFSQSKLRATCQSILKAAACSSAVGKVSYFLSQRRFLVEAWACLLLAQANHPHPPYAASRQLGGPGSEPSSNPMAHAVLESFAPDHITPAHQLAASL